MKLTSVEITHTVLGDSSSTSNGILLEDVDLLESLKNSSLDGS